MIRFEQTFPSTSSPRDVFAVLSDPVRVVECLPGARLDAAPERGIEAGTELGGGLDVRIGPIKSRFQAQVRVLEIDPTERSYVLGVHARDQRGNGEVSSTVALWANDAAHGTDVHVRADLDVRGKIATFGRATVERVSKRVLDEFAENLARVVAAPAAGALPGVSPEAVQNGGARPRPRAAAEPGVAEPTIAPLGAERLVPASGRRDLWPAVSTGLAFVCGVLAATVVHQRRRR